MMSLAAKNLLWHEGIAEVWCGEGAREVDPGGDRLNTQLVPITRIHRPLPYLITEVLPEVFGQSIRWLQLLQLSRDFGLTRPKQGLPKVWMA